METINFNKKCITLTFWNVVENGPWMETIGSINNHSFSVEQLQNLYNQYEGEKELIHLFLDIKPENILYEPAAVLVLRNFYNSPALFNALLELKWDSKAIFRGQVKINLQDIIYVLQILNKNQITIKEKVLSLKLIPYHYY